MHTNMIRHSIGSIVVKRKSKNLDKYAGSNHIKDYGIVRDTREEGGEEVVNVEWYVDHPSKSKYSDDADNFFAAKLYRTIVQCGKHLEVEYLGLQDIFYQTNDGEWDFDMNHSEYCPHCNMRPCVLEERAEEI